MKQHPGARPRAHSLRATSLIFQVVVASAPTNGDTPDFDPRAEGTRRMARTLAELADNIRPMEHQFASLERAEVMRDRVRRLTGSAREAEARYRFALELANSNQIEEALAQLDLGQALFEQKKKRVLSSTDKTLLHDMEMLRAVAWLRLGELDNCLARHGCESCILPIRPGAHHVVTRGSETAIPLLLAILEKDPEERQAWWLLNLAHMTLGTWPDGVPEPFRIPESAFASECEFPRFPDVARECGVDWTSLSGGVSADDFDGDGLIDLVLTAIGRREQMQVFRNKGDGTFENRTEQSGVMGLTGGLNLIHADYDNDGDVDLYVIRGAWWGEQGLYPDSLLRNRGDGVFDDVTYEAGLFARHPSQAAMFTDLDGDGWLDIVVGNETRDNDPVHPCQLFLNKRDGTFEDVAPKVGADLGAFVKGIAAGDYDNDGRVDLFYSCRSEADHMLHNEPSDEAPGFRFRDVSRESGTQPVNMSFPTYFFDYDNDGWLDLMIGTNAGFGGERCDDITRLYTGARTRSERTTLYRNLGNGTFEDVSRQTGVDRSIFCMGANYGDIDNDGWLDFYFGTGSPDLAALVPNRLFKNDGGKRFLDVTTASGTGHLQKGHGVAFADFDNDGDQDLFEHLGGGLSGDFYPASLFRNPGNSNHWITLRLRGVKANRSAIGARIHVRAATGDVERSIHLVSGTGGSFGAGTLQQEIGLGDADRIVFVEIVWPGSGTVQRLESLPLDRFVAITEGDPAPKLLELPRFELGAKKK